MHPRSRRRAAARLFEITHSKLHRTPPWRPPPPTAPPAKPSSACFIPTAEAQRAVNELKAAGFTDDQIGVASRDREGTFEEQNEETMAEEGAVAGAATGLGAGALWGLGIVAGALPAIGPVIAGGALAAVAASAAGAAAAGGLVGALVGWGIPEEEANYYHSEFESGRTIVTRQVRHRSLGRGASHPGQLQRLRLPPPRDRARHQRPGPGAPQLRRQDGGPRRGAGRRQAHRGRRPGPRPQGGAHRHRPRRGARQA